MVFFRTVSALSKLRSRVAQQSTTLGSVRWLQIQSASDLDLRSQLKDLIPEQQDRLKKLKADHGKVELGKITVDMVIGGMRGMTGLLWETSLLDPEEGIRFRGLSIPECQKVLPAAKPGGEPLPEGLLWLLLTGKVPSKEQVHALSKELQSRSTVPGCYVLPSVIAERLAPEKRKRKANNKGGPSKRVALSPISESPVHPELAFSPPPGGLDEDGQHSEDNEDLGINDYNPVSSRSPSPGREETPIIQPQEGGSHLGSSSAPPVEGNISISVADYDPRVSMSMEELNAFLAREPAGTLPDFSHIFDIGIEPLSPLPPSFCAMMVSANMGTSESLPLEDGEIANTAEAEYDGNAPVEAPTETDLLVSEVVIDSSPVECEVAISSASPTSVVPEGSGDKLVAVPEKEVLYHPAAIGETDFTLPETNIVPSVSECVAIDSSGLLIEESIEGPNDIVAVEKVLPRPITEEFPSHGISWPVGTQPSLPPWLGSMGESIMNALRLAINVEPTPTIEEARTLMQDGTTSYFNMGLPRDPWLPLIDHLWKELVDLHKREAWIAEQAKIDGLKAYVSTLEAELRERRCKDETLLRDQTAVEAINAADIAQMDSLKEQIEVLLKNMELLERRMGANRNDLQQRGAQIASNREEMSGIEAIIVSTSAEIASREKNKPEGL